MKGVMKGKMMKKLKSIKPIEYLKPEKILQVRNIDELVENFPLKPNLKPLKFPLFKDQDSDKRARSKVVASQEPAQNVDVDELVRELEAEDKEEEKGLGLEDDIETEEEDKENIRPSISNDPVKQLKKEESSTASEDEAPFNPDTPTLLLEIDVSSFRRPDMNSVSLFDPNLLAAFNQAVMQHMKAQEDQFKDQSGKSEQPETAETDEEESFPLLNFPEKCPPGGSYSVILYTTSLRGIRKTFEDCHSVLFLLESFRVIFQERDISIHSEFREELWRTLGEKSVPPRLFIMGRYIGGAEEVLGLHEQGRLKPLLEGVPRNQRDSPCVGCGGFRFVVCFRCNGSTRVFDEEEEDDNGGLLSRSRCRECNENGLIVCPYCF